MVKNSFTLFETLLSITLLFIIISGFLNSSYYDEKALEKASLLNTLENKFISNDYTDFVKNSEKITIIKNHNLKEEILVNKYTFQNEDIKIFKYEK
ncbi:MAG: hypothetical protein ACPG9K_03315 [Poseidonibacter sp.]